MKAGGIEFGQDPQLLAELVATVRRATSRPLLVKLSPNVTRIADMAKVCEAEGADGITLINAIQAMEVDVERRRPVLSNILGGLSGPAIRPIALRMVWQAAQAVADPDLRGRRHHATPRTPSSSCSAGRRRCRSGPQNYLDPTAAVGDRAGDRGLRPSPRLRAGRRPARSARAPKGLTAKKRSFLAILPAFI